MKRWTRRSLLIGGAVVALPAAAIGAGKLWCNVRSPSSASLSGQLLIANLFPPSPEIMALGRRYLERTASTAMASLRRLELHEQIARAAKSDCRISMMSALEQACCDDFQYGRVHSIDGWVLAQSELDAAALTTIG